MKIRIIQSLICCLSSLLICSCGYEYEGYYKVNHHQIRVVSCAQPDESEILMPNPDQIIKYFQLKYSGFSLSTYTFERCETEKFTQCRQLYSFSPEEITSSGSKLYIEEQNTCGKKKHFIDATLSKSL